jgi:hypothetical protein
MFAAGPAPSPPGQGGEKKTIWKIQRNPLKRLISGERIQGNPSFSNPHERIIRGKKGGVQENPNRARLLSGGFG